METNNVLFTRGKTRKLERKKTDPGVSVVIKTLHIQPGGGEGNGKIKPHIKNEIQLFFFFLFNIPFLLFYTLLWLFCVCVGFFYVFMFATSKTEGGANHVNVKNFFEIVARV